MKKFALLVWLCLATSICFAVPIVVTVTPEGDGMVGKDRYGYGFPWEWVPFDSTANPNWAGHWYDSPYGSYRDVYMQLAIAGLPAAENIVSASLNINVISASGSSICCNLYHASNSSSANGLASQQIGGGQWVYGVSNSTPAGWLSIDVTNFIKADKTNGYSWSAFQFANVGYSRLTFDSGDSANAPFLAVTVVPEPVSAVILLLGGILLRKRK